MKKKLTKVLVLSLATTLTVGMTSVSTFATDKNISNSLSGVSIPSVSGYSIEDSGLNSKVIATLKEKAAELQNSGVYADATKSTYIKFNGSPVQEVTYDGKPHGLSAGVYATIGNSKVAEADMFYVGVLADDTYYASSEAPTEEGYYYVAATYPGSDEYYPIIAYGIIVIKAAPNTDPSEPEKPKPEEPDNGNKDDGNKDDGNKGAVVDNNNNTKNNTPTIAKVDNKDNTKKAAKTADTSNYAIYLVTLLVAGVATVVTLFARKRR